jgi:hypothetical protein
MLTDNIERTSRMEGRQVMPEVTIRREADLQWES